MTDLEKNGFPSHEELLMWCIYSAQLEYVYATPKSIRKIAATRVELLRELCFPIRERFVHWWKTREIIDDLEIKGYTLGQMVNEQPNQIPCAFRNFNGLYKNPDSYIELNHCYRNYRYPLFLNSKKSNSLDLAIVDSEVKVFPSHKELRKRVIKERGTTRSVDDIVQRLQSLSFPIKERFLNWWRTGEFSDDLEIKGYTICEVACRRNIPMLFAFLDFDFLYKNPDDKDFLHVLKYGIS
jgi:hypothetical protein